MLNRLLPQDFSDAKKGDKVYNLLKKDWEYILSVNHEVRYGILTRSNCFTVEGLDDEIDKIPVIYKYDPFEMRQVEVKDNEESKWRRRTFIGEHKGIYICETQIIGEVSYFNFMREIPKNDVTIEELLNAYAEYKCVRISDINLIEK